MAKDSVRRAPVVLNAETERLLILLAEMKAAQSRTQMMEIAVNEFVRSHEQEVYAWLTDKAQRMNLPVDEVERLLLERSNFDFEREYRELGIAPPPPPS